MRLLALILLLLTAGVAQATLPSEKLSDPALEARAEAIGRQLRCVVCQNQSIDDSDAALAHDLRVIVRERLTAGDTDRQAMDYIVARYGNFVLLKPPFEAATLALWLGPLAVLLAGGIGVGLYLSRRRTAAAEPKALDADEQARLDALLNEGDK